MNNFIKSSDVAIYSKSWCPFCAAAKDLFETKYSDKYSVDVVELDQISDGTAIQNYVGKITGVTTVPQIFIHGDCIGGATDAINMHKSGELQEKLDKK